MIAGLAHARPARRTVGDVPSPGTLVVVTAAAGTDERVDLDVNLDEDVPCDADGGCDRPATWRLVVIHRATRRGCVSRFACDVHRAREMRVLARWRARGSDVLCYAHDLPADVEWRPL